MKPARITVVTGSNTGIGRVTAETLAAQGHTVILACRNEAKTAPVVESIRAAGHQAEFLALDLADLDSVAAAAKALLARGAPIRALVNNAGVAGHPGLTRQGFELTFGTNHVGTFLFTTLLLSLLRDHEARVVTVASKAHRQATSIDWAANRQRTATLTGLREYERSKLGNVLFAKELAKREPSLRSVSLHPGVVASDIWRRIPWPIRAIYKRFMITNEEGAQTTLHCVNAPVLENGGYYGRMSGRATERARARPATRRGSLGPHRRGRASLDVVTARYFPVEPKPFAMRAGLFKFPSDFGNGADDARVFQVDAGLERALDAKRIPREAPRYVTRIETPVEARAVQAVLAWATERLRLEAPERLQSAGNDRGAVDAWDALGRAVQEDLVIMHEGAGAGRAVSLHVSFPSGWRPESLAGATFTRDPRARADVPGSWLAR